MNGVPKLLIVLGASLLVIGVMWQIGAKYFHLGKLPGDFAVERENFRFYFPLASSIVISIALSIGIYLFQKFFR